MAQSAERATRPRKIEGDFWMAANVPGAYCRFDQAAADQVAELLGAVAVYAAGGQEALKAISTTNAGAVRLLQQLR